MTRSLCVARPEESRLHHPLHDLAAFERHPIHLCLGPRAYRREQSTADEVRRRAIISGIAIGENSTLYHSLIGRPAHRLTIVVRTMTAAQQAEALDGTKLRGIR